MNELLISLFGRFAVYREDTLIAELNTQKVQELLAYLVFNRQRPQTREQLSAILWADSNPTQARKYLRQALWQLQTGVGLEEGEFLQVDNDYIQLNRRTPIAIDVVIFEDAFLQSRGVAGKDLDVATARVLDQGLALYRGDLLEGWYQDWCIIERERLQNVYLLTLDKLMGYCEFRGLHEEGLLYGDCILRCDCARERTHRRLMRLRYLAGDRTGALRQYERCREILRTELDVAPSSFTDALCEDIRRDNLPGVLTHFGDTVPTAGAPAPAATPAPEQLDALQTLLTRLDALQSHLAQAKSQFDQDIAAIRASLPGTRG